MSDGTKPVLVMMCGLAGSGKSTLAHSMAEEINATVISSDALREEMFGDITDQTHNSEVFNELHRRTKEYLISGRNVIYDACDISSKRRIGFLQQIGNIPCQKECTIMATPYNQCIKNNKNRDRIVPEYVIERMYKQWHTPYWFEGWDNIEVHLSETPSNYAIYWPLDYLEYNQDNPHHNLSLGKHCMQAKYYLFETGDVCDNWFSTVVNAAAIHDCGKPFTKTFKNSKCELTDVAHYYGHEHVGAYDSLLFKYDAGISQLDVSILVDLHMMPYAWEKENNNRLRNKYMKLWGNDLYHCVMILHEADKAAH